MALSAGLAALTLGLIQMPARAEKSIEISLKERYLTLFDNGKVLERFPVAIGAPESPTPAGSYAITRWKMRRCITRGGR